ncbi:MAG: sugar phosphate isomerase/epimerase [Opitutus sp.]|nr:sugar phosphate isomerase/epimerase [Opitutus sp.]
MKNQSDLNRRQFLQAGGLGLAALAAGKMSLPLYGAAAKPRFGGLKLGVASYSFRKFNLDQAIAMTVELGLKYISLKEVHLPLKSTTAERQAARKKVEAAGLVLLGGGVIYLANQEDAVRHAFEYARDAGMPTIVTSPELAAIDLMEKYAIKHDIRVAIHNHGPGDKKYPLPIDAFRLIEKRDPRLGICIDVGHTLRVGGEPVGDIRKYASRLYDVHIKDVSAIGTKFENVPYGKGILDVRGVLQALLDIKFSDHLEMEYEATPDDPLPGMKESVAYVQKVVGEMT